MSNTTFGELKRQVLLRMEEKEGRALLAVEQAINDAHKIIAAVKDFDDLMVFDTTHAFTSILTATAVDLTFATHSITRATGSFITDGFVMGNTIYTNATLNPGPFIIESVAELTIVVAETLVAEVFASCVLTFNRKSYHVTDNLALVRPKDIYSIKYMDGANSRKLTYVPFRELDQKIPYTELVGYGRPTWYTVRGSNVELFRIPDAVKPLYIMHSQWPAVLTNDTDLTPFANIDYAIVNLAADIATAILKGGGSIDWLQGAQQALGIAIKEEIARPDRVLVAQPFNVTSKGPIGEYWSNPFVKSQL